MKNRMVLCGEIVAIGDMAEEDLPGQLVGIPTIQLKASDGRIITVTGLTREECRAAAPLFGKQASFALRSLED